MFHFMILFLITFYSFQSSTSDLQGTFVSSDASSTSSSDYHEYILPNDYYSEYNINFLPEENLTKIKSLGTGKTSDVFLGKLNNDTDVAIKYLKPLARWRLNREVSITEKLQDIPQVIKYYGTFGTEEEPILVMELGNHSFTSNLTLPQLQWIMGEILDCLNQTHYRGIMHRDIKMQNVIIDLNNKKLKIIDWGLSEVIDHKLLKSNRVGTKSYKSPELLLGFKEYDERIDIWAAGIIMANLVFGIPTLFHAADNDGVLYKQNRFFGHDVFDHLNQIYGTSEPIAYIRQKQSFLEYALPHTRHLINNETIGMLKHMLNPEMYRRPSAEHLFFEKFMKHKYDYWN